MAITGYKLVWAWPIVQRDILGMADSKDVVRLTVGDQPTTVSAPISGVVTSITVTNKRKSFSVVEITTTLPDTSVITNKLFDVAGVTVIVGATVVRGQSIGTTTGATSVFTTPSLSWSATALSVGSKSGIAVVVSPVKLAELMGNIQDPETGTQPESPQAPMIPPPLRHVGVGVGAGLGTALLVGGIAWLLLRDSKKEEEE